MCIRQIKMCKAQRSFAYRLAFMLDVKLWNVCVFMLRSQIVFQLGTLRDTEYSAKRPWHIFGLNYLYAVLAKAPVWKYIVSFSKNERKGPANMKAVLADSILVVLLNTHQWIGLFSRLFKMSKSVSCRLWWCIYVSKYGSDKWAESAIIPIVIWNKTEKWQSVYPVFQSY